MRPKIVNINIEFRPRRVGLDACGNASEMTMRLVLLSAFALHAVHALFEHSAGLALEFGGDDWVTFDVTEAVDPPFSKHAIWELTVEGWFRWVRV